MFQWDKFLARHREQIVGEWQKRLQTEVSEHYSKRPPQELNMTTGKACDALSRVLAKGDFSLINVFISEITRIRLDEDFPLADVQKAFELFRQIITPLLVRESPASRLCENIEAVNRSLAYTIHRFSNHFQNMHETCLKEYARRLEDDVARRTAELKDSEQQYKSLLEEISDGYLALRSGRIGFVNPAFCRMHDVAPDEVLQHPFLEFVAPESRETVSRMISRDAVNGTEPEAFEYLRQKKDGARLPTEINFRQSWFRGEECCLCIVRDITKRVRMEKKSRELERMAYIGRLTASLSHEIRNPLSSVKMNLQILGKNNPFHGNDKKRLDISEREIRRLEGILKELLDFAKPVALQPEKTDINQIIFSSVELLEVKISKRDIHCDIQVDKTLPPVMADKGKVEQMMINLLLNALDFAKESGHIAIATQKRVFEDMPYAAIIVRDDGKGIPKRMLSRIFEPFYTTKTTGTGLGLANVKRIVEAHKGRVDVVALHTPGTAFEVLLPLGGPP